MVRPLGLNLGDALKLHGQMLFDEFEDRLNACEVVGRRGVRRRAVAAGEGIARGQIWRVEEVRR